MTNNLSRPPSSPQAPEAFYLGADDKSSSTRPADIARAHAASVDMSHRMRSRDASRRFGARAGSGSGMGGTPANGNSVHLGGEVGAAGAGDVSGQGMSYLPLQPREFRGSSGRGTGAGGDGEEGGAVVVEVGPAGGADERTPLTGGNVPSSSAGAGAGAKGGFGREL